jgi:hypothetical protein
LNAEDLLKSINNWRNVVAGIIRGWNENHVSVASATNAFPLLKDFWSSVAATHRNQDTLVSRRSTNGETSEQ